MTFSTLNQSMWAEGAQSSWSGETFLGAKWGTYNGDAPVNASIGGIEGIVEKNICIGGTAWGHCIGYRTDIDLRLGLEAGINSSGQIGLIPYAQASGGAIDVTLPVQATLSLPDQISSNEIFNISALGGAQNGASITAKAPSFQAGVDGVFDSDNELYGLTCFVGCIEGSVDVNLNAGRFELLGFDSSKNNPLSAFGVEVPIPLFDEQLLIHAPTPDNPDGVDDDVTPQKVPTPVIGNLIFRNPDDKSGGAVSGNKVALQTNQNIFEAKVSVTGVIETLLGSPGVLRNEINIVGPIGANYTIADFSVGPILGMQQNFGLDPHAAVRLEFDKPITRMVTRLAGYQFEPTVLSIGVAKLLISPNPDGSAKFCVTIPNAEVCDTIGAPTGPEACTNILVYDNPNPICLPASPVYETVAEVSTNGIVELALNQTADLRFDGEVGQLIGRTYYLSDPKFSNRTAATIDPAIQLQVFCAGFAGLGDKCLYDETFQTTGLTQVPVYSNNWVLGGFGDFKYDDVFRFGDSGGSGGPGDSVALPEPGTLWLMLLGFTMIAVPRKRSRRIS